MNTQAFGAIESPPDYRDGFAASAVAVAPAPAGLQSFYFDMSAFPVLMQGLQPACINHWLAMLMKVHFFKKTGKVVNFSARFGDVLCKQFDGQPIDGGTYPRLALKLACKYGMATTATVANDTTLPLAQYRDPAVLTTAAYAEAAQYKLPGFVQVALDPQRIRDAIYAFGFVGTLKKIGSEWWLPSWADKDIDPLRVPKDVVSGHMTGDFGWNNNLNRLRNSWSAAWANGGNSDYDLNAWLGFTSEAWAAAEIPVDMQKFLADLPSPASFHYQWGTDLHQGNTVPLDDVKFLQIALMILGYMTPPPPDQLGYYGPHTAAAVLAYQKAEGVPGATQYAGSIVGPQTRLALDKQFAL